MGAFRAIIVGGLGSVDAPLKPGSPGLTPFASVLVMLGDAWRGCRVGEGGWTISLQPKVIGAAHADLLPR